MSEEKAKDTPEYWGAYYKGIEMLYDPRVTTTGVGGVSVINDIFNDASSPCSGNILGFYGFSYEKHI
ncbi:hypothetical protein [Campylobacter pinnipediorum]|uniref:hypothetical protein n=1 Tax=Campylobacter pinnipediorum TaxID=1965231 RepID=UPI00084DACBD|nr:hypothetical protein [Campylobacter pinnipediorum]